MHEAYIKNNLTEKMVQIANSKQNFQLKCQNDLTYSVESCAFIMSGNFDVLLVCTCADILINLNIFSNKICLI